MRIINPIKTLTSTILAGLLLSVYAVPTAPVFAQNQPLEGESIPYASTTTTTVRALDKITARITELELPQDEDVAFGTLLIKARTCRSRPPEETPETFAFLEIDDLARDGERTRVFTGWMLASSPALNPLEHSVYDIWVISCRTASGGVSEGIE